MKMNLQLFAGSWAPFKIYSNDGNISFCDYDRVKTTSIVTITSTGVMLDNDVVYTYSGVGTFLGVTGTVNSSVVLHAPGDSFEMGDSSAYTIAHGLILYIVEQSAETYKHLTLSNNTKIQVDSAIRDGQGNRIKTVYAKKDELSNITSTDVTITETN